MNPTNAIRALFHAAHESLLELEQDVALFGIPIPATPIAEPIGNAPEALAVAAQRMDERFSGWNSSLLESEGHLEDATTRSLEARKLGRRAHTWYETTKELYWSLGLSRHHEATTDLYRRAMCEAEENEHARRFLMSRGICMPLQVTP